MKEEVAFELGSFYANAGILGLVRMLECDYKKSEGKYRFDGPLLYIDKEYLLDTDLTELFMQTLISLEQDTGKFPRIYDGLKNIYELLQYISKLFFVLKLMYIPLKSKIIISNLYNLYKIKG